MRSKRSFRAVGFVLLLVMILAAAGCSKKESREETMGRYQEKTVKLPIDDHTLHIVPDHLSEQLGGGFQLFDEFGSRYIMEKDGKWKKKKVSWFTQKIHDGIQGVKLATLGDDGKEYVAILYCKEDSTYGAQAKLFQCSKKKAKQIAIKDLEEKAPLCDEPGEDYPNPQFIHVFEDHSILLCYDQTSALYDKSGNVKYELNDTFGKSAVVRDKELYVINGQKRSVDVYDTTTGDKKQEIPLGALMTQTTCSHDTCGVLCFGKDDVLYLQNKNGIHQLSKGGNVWTTILDGSLCSMYSDEFETIQFQENEDGSFYVIGAKEYGFEPHMYQYTYDENVMTVPDKTVTIYALNGSPIVRQAIIEFQNQHPDVRVDYQVAISDTDGNQKVDDCIKQFNTELLSGNGPDLIMMDGLNLNSYIKNGILEDISSLIQPMISSGQLQQSVAESFKREKAVYALPTRLQIPIISGTKEALEHIHTLDELARYAEMINIPIMSGSLETDEVNNLYQNYAKDLYDENGQLDLSKVSDFLENFKVIYDHSEMLDPKQKDEIEDSAIYQLKDKASALGMSCIERFQDVQEKLLLIHITGCDMKTVNQLFYPKEIVAINHASKQKETAKQFIEELLTDEIQAYQVYDSLPVNLNQIVPIDLTEDIHNRGFNAVYTYMKENGGVDKVEIPFPKKKDVKNYLAVYEDMKQPYVSNYEVDQAMLTAIKGYVHGEKSLEDSVSSIQGFIRIYTKE